MALRNIVTEKEARLRKVSRPVEKFDERLWTLLDDMADTMYEADGVGIAGVQVGVLRRVFVVDIGEGLTEFINPTITAQSGEQDGLEGCLSSPGEYGLVVRHEDGSVETVRSGEVSVRGLYGRWRRRALWPGPSATKMTTWTAIFLRTLPTTCLPMRSCGNWTRSENHAHRIYGNAGFCGALPAKDPGGRARGARGLYPAG